MLDNMETGVCVGGENETNCKFNGYAVPYLALLPALVVWYTGVKLGFIQSHEEDVQYL